MKKNNNFYDRAAVVGVVPVGVPSQSQGACTQLHVDVGVIGSIGGLVSNVSSAQSHGARMQLQMGLLIGLLFAD